MDIRIGCCGFAAAKSKYYESFPVVEIQRTFYQLPRLETAEKWRREAPEDFEFTMKAWQLITHEPSSPTYRRLKEPIDRSVAGRYGAFRDTAEVRNAWERTAQFAKHLGARILLFQCPARFRAIDENVANLRRFFENLQRDRFIFAWEPRGGWPEELVKGLCRELRLVHCVDPLKSKTQWGNLAYYRLHGRTGYRYVHTEEDFAAIALALRPDAPNYVMFNNEDMFSDARRFVDFLRKKAES